MSFISRALARLTVKGFSELAQAGTGYDVIGGQSKLPAFAAAESFKHFKSWVYIAANRNAVATSGAPVKLYATRQEQEDMPKIAPYRTISYMKQHSLKQTYSGLNQVAQAQDIVEITEHPFLDLMRKVNPFRTACEFRQETSLQFDLSGNCYWYIMKGDGVEAGIPSQLWLLPSNLVRIVPSEKDFIEGYIYGQRGKEIALMPDEVIHFRRPSVDSQYYGTGRVQAQWAAIHGTETLDQYEASTAKHPVPEILIKYLKGTIDPKKRRELQFEFNRQFQDAAQKGSYVAGIADEDFSVEKLSFSPREVAGLNGRRWYRQLIIEAFGQTLALYDTQAARATIEGAIYLWAKHELDVTNKLFAEKMNESLIPMYDSGNRLFCAFEPIATDDTVLNIQQETADRNNSIRTPNEIRVSRGFPPSTEEGADSLFKAVPEPATPEGFLALERHQTDRKTTHKNNKNGSRSDSFGARYYVDGKAIHKDLEGTPICTWL